MNTRTFTPPQPWTPEQRQRIRDAFCASHGNRLPLVEWTAFEMALMRQDEAPMSEDAMDNGFIDCGCSNVNQCSRHRLVPAEPSRPVTVEAEYEPLMAREMDIAPPAHGKPDEAPMSNVTLCQANRHIRHLRRQLATRDARIAELERRIFRALGCLSEELK